MASYLLREQDLSFPFLLDLPAMPTIDMMQSVFFLKNVKITLTAIP